MGADASSLKVSNAIKALNTALFYLQEREIREAPDTNTTWQEKTIYSTGPQDYIVTGKLFTSGDWLVDVSQNVAPLSRTVYRVIIYNSEQNYHWLGDIRADGSVEEISTFRPLSEQEGRETAAEFRRKNEIPPPTPGGYGH